MKKILTMILSIVGGIALSASATVGCQNAEVIGPKLVTDICWSCLFPIMIAGKSLGGTSAQAPEDAKLSPLCACPDELGINMPGVTTSMWEPARLIEFQRVPGCSSVLNGTRLPFDRTNQGTHGNGDKDGGDLSFTHYHYYAFPVMTILDMFVNSTCNSDGFMDIDILYMSELDPTWNNDDLAFFTNPEAAAVANPIAAIACSADAVASNAGRPLKQMFWCAGSWGNLYPLSGNQSGGNGIVQDSSLGSARVLAALHRRGLEWKTMGNDAMCKGVMSPTLPKTQYKFTMFHPVAETNSSHVMGESTLIWGSGRSIPAVGEDPIYVIWRWNDCCNTYNGSE